MNTGVEVGCGSWGGMAGGVGERERECVCVCE